MYIIYKNVVNISQFIYIVKVNISQFNIYIYI